MKIVDEEWYEVRCPADRPHVIGGYEYPLCGTIMGGYHIDSRDPDIYRCPTCGAWFKVFIKPLENTVLSFEQLEQKRYNFTQPIRTVNNE